MICLSSMRGRTFLVGLVVVGLLGAACGGSDDRADLGPTATVPEAPSSTTTTNPYAVPEVIDVAYVNRVLAGLDQAVGEVVRLVVKTKTIPPEAVERLKALYVGEFLQLTIDGFQKDMRNGFAGYQASPGNKKTTVAGLRSARSDCIFAEVRRDFSEVSLDPNPQLSTQWVALTQSGNSDGNGYHYNPTLWRFKYDGFQPGFVAPKDPCAL